MTHAIDRCVNETRLLYGVLDKRLQGSKFIAGETYSIADMAAFPWIVPNEAQGMKLEDFPHLKRWFKHVHGREATRRAYAIADTIKDQVDLSKDEAASQLLFGQGALKT